MSLPVGNISRGENMNRLAKKVGQMLLNVFLMTCARMGPGRALQGPCLIPPGAP